MRHSLKPTHSSSRNDHLASINETYSLSKRSDSILETSKPDLRELLIIVAKRPRAKVCATIGSSSARLGDLVVVHRQKLKFLGGAMREAFDLARGSHAIMMASDLETDPGTWSRA